MGSTKAGINMDAVALMGKTVKAVAEATAERDGLGVGEPDVVIDVGVSGPGVVNKALQRALINFILFSITDDFMSLLVYPTFQDARFLH